jgi:uncharacterized membrane protein YccC
MPLKLSRSAEVAVAFALRCSASCALAYQLTYWIGAPQPIWAAVSAVVVSQERFTDTRTSLGGRVAGTVLGAAISVAVGWLFSFARPSEVIEVAVAVALAAFAAHRFPSLRVAMWTCPIVLLSADGSAMLTAVALRRAGVVIFGALVAFALHWLVHLLLQPMGVREEPQG